MTIMAARMGRPTEFKPEFCEIAFRLAAEGATDIEIADACEVHVATYYRWRAQHPTFREATKLGKEAADDRVEASLYHRAVGYSHDAVKIFMPAGAKKPVLAHYREHYPPDTAAASLWLRNRRANEWREKVVHAGDPDNPVMPVLNVYTSSTDDRSSPAPEAVNGASHKRH